jgi:hypothetical protein
VRERTLIRALQTMAVAASLAAPCQAAGPRSYDGVKADVAKHGWTCVAVSGDRPERRFAYSVGLSSKHLPELGIFGTDEPGVACSAIDRVARLLVAAGRPPRNGAEVFRTGEGRVVLRAVLHEQFYDRCTLAKRWRDEHRIAGARAMQILVLDPGEQLPR